MIPGIPNNLLRAMHRAPVFAPYKPHANNQANNSGTPAKLERITGNEPLAASKGEKEASGRVHFKFVSVRKRLIDPDNVSVKWLLDCCRRIGLVAGDEHDKITLETAQRRANKNEEEHTEVTINYP